MLVELEKRQYHQVRPLLSDEGIQIVCLGVINQDFQGQIWVDHETHPKTALLIDNLWVIYLLGDPTNKSFNQQAGGLIREYIFPSRKNDKQVDPGWVLVYYSDMWLSKLQSEFNLTNWFQVEIRHYQLHELQVTNWKDLIPPGFSIEKVTQAFLANPMMTNHEGITNWIYQRWTNPSDFLKRGFCFYLVNETEEIVSWAISEWVTENYILLGLSTLPKYQQHGYASLAVAAASEEGILLKRDLRWFCATNNRASWKTAEKIGYQKIKEQNIIIGEYHDLKEE